MGSSLFWLIAVTEERNSILHDLPRIPDLISQGQQVRDKDILVSEKKVSSFVWE